MPSNRRERILQRILAVLGGVEGVAEVDGVKSVFRNRPAVPPELRPAIVMLDGRMTRRVAPASGSRTPPALMALLPQIFVLLPLSPNNMNEGIGEELSEFELRVLVALFTDGLLWELLGGDSGQIEYTDLDTDMQTGSSMEGQQQIGLAFTYEFDPNEMIR